MKPVEFAPEAMDEIRDAIAFMNGGWPGLGDDFETEVERAADLIGKQPKAFSPDTEGYRKYVLKRFGYVLYYFEYDTYVWVATVHHGSRDPTYWRQRQPPQ